MKRIQQQYNDTINLISHLILTNPNAVNTLLTDYGLKFPRKPTKMQLADGVIELLKTDTTNFQKALETLLTLHVKDRGKEMLALERGFNSYDDGDQDAFFGGIAKIGLGLVGKLLKGKGKRRKKSRSVNNTSLLASQAAASRRLANAQAARMRKDFQQQMFAQQLAARKQREEAERRCRLEVVASKKREEAVRIAADKKVQNTVIVGGVLVAAILFGNIIFIGSRSKTSPITYMPQSMVSK